MIDYYHTTYRRSVEIVLGRGALHITREFHAFGPRETIGDEPPDRWPQQRAGLIWVEGTANLDEPLPLGVVDAGKIDARLSGKAFLTSYEHKVYPNGQSYCPACFRNMDDSLHVDGYPVDSFLPGVAAPIDD